MGQAEFAKRKGASAIRQRTSSSGSFPPHSGGAPNGAQPQRKVRCGSASAHSGQKLGAATACGRRDSEPHPEVTSPSRFGRRRGRECGVVETHGTFDGGDLFERIIEAVFSEGLVLDVLEELSHFIALLGRKRFSPRGEYDRVLARCMLFIHEGKRFQGSRERLGAAPDRLLGHGQDVVGDLTAALMLSEQGVDFAGSGAAGFLHGREQVGLFQAGAPAGTGGSAGASGQPAQGTAGSVAGGGGGSPGTAGGAPVTSFPDVTVFEADACHDLDIAVSPDFVATATNSGHIVFYKRDGTVDHKFDMMNDNGDQHIVWDDSSKRWFFSFMDKGLIDVAASLDATGKTWTPWLKIDGPTDVDNPNLTVTSDKVALVNYACIYVVDKSVVMAGATKTITPPPQCGLGRNDQIYGVDYGSPVPSTAYFVTMSDDQHVNWITVDGTPKDNNVVVKQHPTAVTGFSTMPAFPGIQQQGGSYLRNSGQVADWIGGHLWWSKAGKCANAPTLTCVRMFNIDTAVASEKDFEYAVNGASLWSAAPTVDFAGNMWTLMAQVSPTTPPSLVVAGMSAAGVRTEPKIVFQGTQPDVTAQSGGDWGDFFDCAQDPKDGSSWCIGNYGGPAKASCPTPAKVVHITTK